jgi:putative hydrolase of the HAD superfamily
MIRTVIFDVDDTLYSFSHADKAALEELIAYANEQFGWDEEEFRNRQKAAMADVKRFAGTSGGYRARILRYQNMLEAAGLPLYPHAHAMSRIYQDTLLDSMIPSEGVEEWMRSLSDQKMRIGIGSDATAMQQVLKLERLGLLSYVDFMVTSEEAGVEKPDPKFFERCSEKCGCQPDEVLFIGDNLQKDFAGAQKAGFHALWYNPNGKTCDFPVKELRSFKDAWKILDEINSAGKGES